MYDARQIANWFVQRAAADNRQLTIMQLLKLVYIAHGWHLEMRDTPLISNKIEAWKYGPVIPDVYNAFRTQGIFIQDPIVPVGQSVTDYDAHLLNEIYRIYGHMSAQKLSDITHEDGSPWKVATLQSGWFAPISNDVILSHYQKKRHEAQSKP